MQATEQTEGVSLKGMEVVVDSRFEDRSTLFTEWMERTL